MVEDGFVDVGASDPGIRYVGRLDSANPDAPTMAFPPVTIATHQEMADVLTDFIQQKKGW